MRLRSVGHVLLDGVETLSAAMQQPNLYIEQLTAPFGSIWKALVALVSSCFAFWIIARLASSDEAFSFNFVNNHTYVYIHTIPLIYIYMAVYFSLSAFLPVLIVVAIICQVTEMTRRPDFCTYLQAPAALSHSLRTFPLFYVWTCPCGC